MTPPPPEPECDLTCPDDAEFYSETSVRDGFYGDEWTGVDVPRGRFCVDVLFEMSAYADLLCTDPIRARAAELCCAPFCPICPDGSGPIPDGPDSGIDRAPCRELRERPPLVSADSYECLDASLAAMFECGCDYASPPFRNGETSACTVCSDGTALPHPSMSFEQYECGVIEWSLSFSNVESGSDECDFYQGYYGPPCGCPVNPELACPDAICPEGTEFLFSEPVGTDRCNELLMEANLDDERCNASNVTFLIDNCCAPPPPLCGYCPPGLVLSNPEMIADEVTGATCGDIDASLSALPGGYECLASRALLMEGLVPNRCGYCVLPPPDADGERPTVEVEACTLCHDRSTPSVPSDFDMSAFRPPESDDGAAPRTVGCGYIAYSAALAHESDDLDCAALRESHWGMCGCPAPPESETLPGLYDDGGPCSLCPRGMMPEHPDAVFDASAGETCASALDGYGVPPRRPVSMPPRQKKYDGRGHDFRGTVRALHSRPRSRRTGRRRLHPVPRRVRPVPVRLRRHGPIALRRRPGYRGLQRRPAERIGLLRLSDGGRRRRRSRLLRLRRRRRRTRDGNRLPGNDVLRGRGHLLLRSRGRRVLRRP